MCQHPMNPKGHKNEDNWSLYPLIIKLIWIQSHSQQTRTEGISSKSTKAVPKIINCGLKKKVSQKEMTVQIHRKVLATKKFWKRTSSFGHSCEKSVCSRTGEARAGHWDVVSSTCGFALECWLCTLTQSKTCGHFHCSNIYAMLFYSAL